MNQVGLISYVLWLGPLAGEVALLWILYRRGAHRDFRWFTGYLAFKVFHEVVSIPLHHWWDLGFFYFYWVTHGIQALLELAVIYELFARLLTPAILQRVRSVLFHGGTACLVGLALFATIYSPSAESN